MKLLPYILFQKYINTLASEMASRENQHRARCIGTHSFSTHIRSNDNDANKSPISSRLLFALFLQIYFTLDIAY